MNPFKVLTVNEEGGDRLFVIKETSDYNKVALRLLRERNHKSLYYSSENVRQALQEDLISLQDHHSTHSNEYKDAIAELTEYYKVILEFCLKLEELLSLPKEKALNLEWVFDDGETTPLAYALLAMRRHLKFEGYSITSSEWF
jgi:aminopeptidase-like protein